MAGAHGPEGFFQIDPDVWTCPKCNRTYRAKAFRPEDRTTIIRLIRDSHKCKKGQQ